MYGFRSGYGVPFAFGGFMIFYAALYVLAPAVVGVATGDELSGFNQDRDADLMPLLMFAGGVAVILIFGSSYLRRQVEAEDEAERTGQTREDKLARALGLSVEDDPVGKHKVLAGKRGDVWVAVHLERRKIRIVARHDLRLPASFSIQAGKAKGDRFGNVVLDGALRASGLSALETDWTHPRTTALLMEVLHQHPGSVVDGKNIVVAGKLKEAQLDGLLDSIAALVGRLGTPAAPVERPRFPGR